jgi:hypothetical protein
VPREPSCSHERFAPRHPLILHLHRLNSGFFALGTPGIAAPMEQITQCSEAPEFAVYSSPFAERERHGVRRHATFPNQARG